MAEEKRYLRFPGYVSVKEAAGLLGVKEGKLWYNIRVGKLRAEKIEGRNMIPEPDLMNFQADARGRRRTEPILWRAYRGGSRVYGLQIEVQARTIQREDLQTRIQMMLLEEQRVSCPMLGW